MFCITFLHFLYLLYRWVCHMCVSLYLQHPLINAAVQPPRLIFVPVLHLLLPPFYSFNDEVVHIEPCLLLLHTCLSLCFSVSVFVFAINIDQCFSHCLLSLQGDMSPNLCVSISVRSWYFAAILPQIYIGRWENNLPEEKSTLLSYSNLDSEESDWAEGLKCCQEIAKV